MDNSYSTLMQSLFTSTKTIFPDNKVIKANLSEAEPEDPYVVFRIIREQQLGLGYNDTFLSATNVMTTRVNYEAVVQFSFTSKDEGAAGSMAKTFVQALNSPLTRETFRKNKLSKVSMSPLRGVPLKRETMWVQSFNIDVTFNYAVVTSDVMTPITVVQIEDEIEGTVFTVPPDVVIP